MEILNYWLEIVCAVGGILITFIPFIISLIKVIKDRKNKDIEIDLTNELEKLVVEAEECYKQLNIIMKTQRSGTAGEVKKKSVLTELENYAFKKEYKFDSDKWSKKVDEVVAMTKKVN